MPEFCRLPKSELDVMPTVWKQGGEAGALVIEAERQRRCAGKALRWVSESLFRYFVGRRQDLP